MPRCHPRPDDTIRNSLLPRLPANQVLGLDFSVKKLGNATLGSPTKNIQLIRFHKNIPQFNTENDDLKFQNDTVDGRNPAPLGMYKTR